MTDKNSDTKTRERLKSKLIIGSIILLTGFLSPLLIPVVVSSQYLSATSKTVITGLLAFGIPEVFMLVAIAIMGRKGFNHLKQTLLKKIRPLLPPDHVSTSRYRLGLVMFCTPILLGIIQPYLAHYVSFFKDIPLRWVIFSDTLLLISLFILGGDFWEKLKGLFSNQIIAIKRAAYDPTSDKIY